MHHPAVKHTIDIFERVMRELPPLVPKEVVIDMNHALEQIRLNFDLTLIELEDTMIIFGKQVWPYRRAFEEFVSTCEGRLGETFLLAKVSSNLKKKYKDFIVYGGDYRDLHSGAPVDFFKTKERLELGAILVEVKIDLRKHTAQEVLSTRRKEYEEKVIEFQTILDDMEKRLNSLRVMADSEQEHPQLAAEIRENIRGFEYGLTALGPHPDHHAVCNAEEYFQGRKKYKKLLQSHSI